MTFLEFLIKAKIYTYASGGEGGEKILDDGSKEFVFQKGNYVYRDRYFGSKAFIGEEIVFEFNKQIWGMNYYGKIFTDNLSTKEIYSFLKKAMQLVTEKRPFRGPDHFTEGNFIYTDKSVGDASWFEGVEEIFYNDVKVYELKYHGGNL